MASESDVVLLYTGNSLGEYQACPTCGQYSEGGLDRRATMLANQRAAGDTIFLLSGGYDFTSYIKHWRPKGGQLEALAEAYAKLGYDLGVLAAGDQQYLGHAGLKPPAGFVPVAEEPEVRILTKGKIRLGVVLCPVLEGKEFTPEEKQLESVAKAATALRDQCDIVVAVSTWGGRGESAFLKAFPGVVDVLLGSGPGSGAGARVMSDGATLWLRPKPDGRAVMRLGLASFLSAGKWNKDFLAAETLSLDFRVKGDGRISTLFAWI
ncbi:hypothetical protein [Desulfovibrio ferrophilus]|nr:hypothetical protein [Desulfovibrio ferrophilus]